MDGKIRKVVGTHKGIGQILDQGKSVAEVEYKLTEWQRYGTASSGGETEAREEKMECKGSLTIRKGDIQWEKAPLRLRTDDGRETDVFLNRSTRRCKKSYSRTDCPIVWSGFEVTRETDSGT